MAKQHRNPFYPLSLLGIGFILLLNACNGTPGGDMQTPTQATSVTPMPSATLSPTNTPTNTPTPIVEPVLPPMTTSAELAVQPPDFNLPSSEQELIFDLVDAHAVYALYRQQQGPTMWASDQEFIADMSAYATQLEKQGIDLVQATVEGQTFSLLTQGNKILLNFSENGALQDSDPGKWSKDSTPEWVDVGSQVELFIGEDGHAYIAKVDADGNVTAFLNTSGATKDNLDDQWIEVKNGQATMVWDKDKKTWVESPLATIPAEWQGKIDRIETLDDGRIVAIATSTDPEKESLLRVLEFDEKSGEWISYSPIITQTINDDAINYLYPNGLPEIIHPSEVELQRYMNYSENPEIPLGYIGRTYLDSEKEVWLDWASGIVIGFSFPSDKSILAIRIQVPTATGDLVIIDDIITNQFQSGSNIFTLESYGFNSDEVTSNVFELDSGLSNDWIIRGSQLYDYFIEHQNDWVGKQLIFGIAGGNTNKPELNLVNNDDGPNGVELRQKLVKYIRGEIDIDQTKDVYVIITALEGFILPQEVIEQINGY